MIATGSMGAYAFKYAEHGWHVFPAYAPTDTADNEEDAVCSCWKGAACQHPGKHPRYNGGHLDATTDPKQLRRWWGNNPNDNIALAPGPSGLCVIDVDGADGDRAATALGLFAEPTLSVVSGRSEGGMHLYYKHPDFTVGNSSLAYHLDVRCDQGYVILPPSLHWSGAVYRWDHTTKEVLPLPPCAHDELKRLQYSRGSGARLNLNELTDGLCDGVRHNTLRGWIGRWVGKGMSRDEIIAVALAVNGYYGRPPTDESDVLNLVQWTLEKHANGTGSTDIVPLNVWRQRRKTS